MLREEAGDTPHEACVYVNNMNTATATTALPDRRTLQRRGHRAYHDAAEDALRSPSTHGEPNTQLRATVDATDDGAAHDGAMTQRLERAYQRIMRRLQRQINYDEPARVPLAQQFQLDHRHVASDGGAALTGGGAMVRYRADSLGAKDEADADGDERSLAMQPCPMPLRLVVRHVQAVLQNKMHMAECGSMKDCLRYTFESRALLDRLLKEMPSYVQFQESMLTAPHAARHASGKDRGVHLHELYKSFRTHPVLLPRGRYVEDGSTGVVRAELDLSQQRVMAEAGRLEGSGTSLPHLVLPSIGADATGAAARAASETTTPRTVSLPASYGRSARLPSTTGERSEDEATPPPRHGARTRATEELNRTATLNHTLSQAESTTGDTMMDMAGLLTTRQRRLQPKLRALLATYSEKERQATQTTEVGTLTEENALTTVSRQRYEELERRVKELEVQLQEAHSERRALVEQVRDGEAHTASRAHVIDYLRRTLVRECNTLRSQLYFAAQKEQQLLQRQQSSGRDRGAGPASGTTPFTNTMHSASGAGGSLAHPHHPAPTRSGLSSPRLAAVPALSQRRMTTTGTPDSGASEVKCNEVSISQYSPYLPHDNAALTSRPRRESSMREYSVSLAEHPAHDAAGPLIASDITAVQSLLDLVLLAVEKEAPLPVSVQAAREMGVEGVGQLMDADARSHWGAARAEFEQKQRTLKEMVTSMRVHNTFVLATKEKEIARLQSLTDTKFVHRAIQDAIDELRSHSKQVRRYVQEQLYTFQVNLTSTIASFSNRIKLVERTLVEHAALQNTHDAMRDLVDSAASLLLPMLTPEYTHGYHPWPVKVRNTTDPLAHAIQLQHGQVEVIHLRPQLDVMSKIYVALHEYVMRAIVAPEPNRPIPGRPLHRLCAALMLSPVSSTDVLYAVRQHHTTESELRRELARLNGGIAWNAYLQRAYTERAVSALVEGGMSPNTTSLPVAPRINALAREREVMTRARTALQKRRSANAKEVYRLWKEKQIDIYDGRKMPVFHNRLTLLMEGGHGAVRPRRGTRPSRTVSNSIIADPGPHPERASLSREIVDSLSSTLYVQ